MIDFNALGITGDHVSFVVGLMLKVLLIMLTLVALIAVRQTMLMDRVVKVPAGKYFKLGSWIFFWSAMIMTAIVVVLV